MSENALALSFYLRNKYTATISFRQCFLSVSRHIALSAHPLSLIIVENGFVQGLEYLILELSHTKFILSMIGREGTITLLEVHFDQIDESSF